MTFDTNGILGDAKPQRWWQWFLLYPAAAVALVSAAPQWLDRGLAIYHGTRGASYAAADRQRALWLKNMTCSQAPFAWYHNPRNVRIDATICNSGDVFIRASTPDNEYHMEWVGLDQILGVPSADGTSLIPEARAASMSSGFGLVPRSSAWVGHGARLFRADYQANAMIVCQRPLDSRRLYRHVRTPVGCFDEVIDMLNGAVIQRTQVPCRNAC